MTAWKAARQLGWRQVTLFAWYRLLLFSGALERQTQPPQAEARLALRPLRSLPEAGGLRAALGAEGQTALLAEADEIAAGLARLFGGEPRVLDLQPPQPLRHWTAYERGGQEQALASLPHGDVKFAWEAVRFGWAFTLGRAYRLSGEERYPQAFWRYFEAFDAANPPYQGLNWVSAQEAALRILAFVFAGQVFAASPDSTPERRGRLAAAVAAHAARIPPTLAYARAQNNNHLLSEAAGLYTAGLALEGHPHAARWRELGWRWFHAGAAGQFGVDGAYMQHSTSYQRLALQLGLWMRALSAVEGRQFPAAGLTRLQAGTRWLAALLDESGRAPNLGPQDGAYVLPLAGGGHGDYRPAVQACAAAFLGDLPLPVGPWDEMRLWLGADEEGLSPVRAPQPGSEPAILRTPSAWAYLRAARFAGRPGHADQLHLDLWRRGVNLARDAGTYLYNAAAPWDNSLARTSVHNTVSVNGQDQMTRAGRFLWLDWAQAAPPRRDRAADGSWEALEAQHDGYRRLGVIHKRRVVAFRDGRWRVEDDLLPADGAAAGEFTFTLHWLLPDWEWEAGERGEGRGDWGRGERGEGRVELRLRAPDGWVLLRLEAQGAGSTARLRAVRGGEAVYGGGQVEPVLGWYAPAYGQKEPALSLLFEARGRLPLTLATEICFTEDAA